MPKIEIVYDLRQTSWGEPWFTVQGLLAELLADDVLHVRYISYSVIADGVQHPHRTHRPDLLRVYEAGDGGVG